MIFARKNRKVPLIARSVFAEGQTQEPHAKMLGALTLGSLVLMLWSTQAVADDYGAIAYSGNSGNNGYSNNYETRAAAENRAVEECGDDCEVVVWFKNACGALATGDENGYGTGWAGSREEAENIALSSCNENAKNCSIIRWVCTNR